MSSTPEISGGFQPSAGVFCYISKVYRVALTPFPLRSTAADVSWKKRKPNPGKWWS